ncbi:UPF0481 protein At3g47200-like [Malania oleifera]|uniref:UPF0481 protein At3g47200-like n=1 Tax=Malania oleifera TaxID=397392 RepID=UPI0025AE5D9A|nr:UPF0481 protein At3g47200-like [Malania oleifera]XP_057971544.1 UPF0481 protein At3g47200-like [Malania oleifera]
MIKPDAVRVSEDSGPYVSGAAVINIEKINSERLQSALISGLKEKGTEACPKCRMQKVSPLMRRNKMNDKYFDPSVVSIGPYHHGKKELEVAEELKPKVALGFISSSGRQAHEFYNKILEVTGDSRKSYLENSIGYYDNEAFTNMMFLDGCFLLQFIDSVAHDDFRFLDVFVKELGLKGFISFFVDIILLENQLPYAILMALMSVKDQENEREKVIISLENLITKFLEQFNATVEMVRLAGRNYNQKPAVEEPIHLLQLVRRKFIGKGEGKENHAHKNDKYTYFNSVRSALELKAKGIHFQCSNTNFLGDITFTSNYWSCFGKLMLPRIVIDDVSVHLFLNMIAYETAPNTTDGFEVSAYIYFLDSLVDGADDVKELRSRKILSSFSCDEAVSKMIYCMGAEASPDLSTVPSVSKRIQDHYNSRLRAWMAQAWHYYFRSPLAVVALVVAVFVIFLTSAQTYFTVYPPQG